MSEKTEDPTEQRLSQARKRGQIPKTVELIGLFQLSSVLIFFFLQGQALFEDINTLIFTTLDVIDYAPLPAMGILTNAMTRLFVRRIGLLFMLVCLATVAASLVQTGVVLAFEKVIPSFEKFNPINNVKNIFSIRHCIDFAKSLLKLMVVAFVFYYVLQRYVMSFQFLPNAGLDAAIAVTTTIVFWLWSSLIGCYLLFSLADYTFQYYLVMQELKMTKEEVKQEYKDSEGSPEIKSRQRDMQQEIQSGSLDGNVKKANVIIRNPVRIAICVFYQAGKTPLPIITEMGQGEKARQIIAIATKEKIPMIENVELARSLILHAQRDRPIPSKFFAPVAAILRLILKEDSCNKEN